MKKLGAFMSMVLVIAAAAFFGWPLYTETVESGTEKVGSLFGKVQPEPLTEGLNFVNPFVSYPNEDIFDLRPVAVPINDLPMPAQDKLVTTMDVSFNVQFLPGMSAKTRSEVGNPEAFKRSFLENKIQGIIIDVGKAQAKESSDYYGESTLNTIKRISMEQINDMLSGMAVVSNMQFSDIKLPDVIKQAVEATKKKEQEVEKQRQQLDIKALEAAEKTADAEARDNAATFNKSAKEKDAQAEAYRITAEAEAQADANEKIAASITPELIRYMEAQAKLKWDGKQPNTLITGQAPNMLMQMN